jgi:hypothetical protein
VKRVGDVGGLARELELEINALCINAVPLRAGAAEELWVALVAAQEERRAAATKILMPDSTRLFMSNPSRKKAWLLQQTASNVS